MTTELADACTSAPPPPWHLYAFTATTALGVATAAAGGATRWRFTTPVSEIPARARAGVPWREILIESRQPCLWSLSRLEAEDRLAPPGVPSRERAAFRGDVLMLLGH